MDLPRYCKSAESTYPESCQIDLDRRLQKDSWKLVFEGVGIVAIVASLILVAMELRQNTDIAQANALFQLSAALDDSYRRRAQDPVLAQLIKDGHADKETLTDLEREQFAAWLRADINHLEAIWTYFDLGLMSDDNFEGLGPSTCSRVTTKGGRRYWQNEAQYFSSSLRKFVEETCF